MDISSSFKNTVTISGIYQEHNSYANTQLLAQVTAAGLLKGSEITITFIASFLKDF